MQISYDEKVRQNPRLFRLTEQATKVLELIVGENGASATATWELPANGHTRSDVLLHLADHTEHVTHSLSPEVLTDPAVLHVALLGLWGDLLRIQSHKLLKALQQPGDD